MSDKSIQGTWGGGRLQLTIQENRATIEMDCAGGVIQTPITLDKSGKFQVSGTFEQYQTGGPQRADEAPPLANARYTGQIKGNTLHLTIHPANGQPPQEFTLQKGARIKLIRCL